MMSRDELVQLVKEITAVEGKTEREINKLIELLKSNVPQPRLLI